MMRFRGSDTQLNKEAVNAEAAASHLFGERHCNLDLMINLLN